MSTSGGCAVIDFLDLVDFPPCHHRFMHLQSRRPSHRHLEYLSDAERMYMCGGRAEVNTICSTNISQDSTPGALQSAHMNTFPLSKTLPFAFVLLFSSGSVYNPLQEMSLLALLELHVLRLKLRPTSFKFQARCNAV